MNWLNFEEAKKKLTGLVSKEEIDGIEDYDFFEVEEGEKFEVVSGFQTFGSGNYSAKFETLSGEEPKLRYIKGHNTDFVSTSYYEAQMKKGTVLKNYEYDCAGGKTRWFKKSVYLCI